MSTTVTDTKLEQLQARADEAREQRKRHSSQYLKANEELAEHNLETYIAEKDDARERLRHEFEAAAVAHREANDVFVAAALTYEAAGSAAADTYEVYRDLRRRARKAGIDVGAQESIAERAMRDRKLRKTLEKLPGLARGQF